MAKPILRDPTTGRYIQADPLGLIDGASVNGYAPQNPGRNVDPRGSSALSAIFGKGAASKVGKDVFITRYAQMAVTGPIVVGDDCGYDCRENKKAFGPIFDRAAGILGNFH